MARYNNRPLGLSQTELADWLGVGRSTISAVEQATRSLPLGVGIQDIRLMLAAEGLVPGAAAGPPQPAPPPVPPPGPEAAPLQQRLAECRHQLTALGFRLRQLQRQAAPYEARLRAIPALRAWAGPVPDPARETLWLDFIEQEAAATLRTVCGAGPQLLLTTRIAGLTHETALLEEALAGLAPVGGSS